MQEFGHQICVAEDYYYDEAGVESGELFHDGAG